MNTYKEILLALRQDLLKAQETGDSAEEPVELDQARVGRLSRMDAMQAQAMSVETGRRRRQQLVGIDLALERVKDGDYGECFECAELINPKRLEANLIATLCITCAQAQE